MLETGELWGIYLQGNVIYGAVHGTIQSTATTFSGSGFDFNLPTATRTAASVSGNYVAGASISGTTSPNGATFTGTYDSFYDTPASLATIQGVWRGQVVSQAGNEVSTFTIGVDGTFAGVVSTCRYSGTALPRPTGKNVFDMSVSFASTGCLFNGATLGGIAVVRNGQLVTLALLPDGSAGFMAIAAR